MVLRCPWFLQELMTLEAFTKCEPPNFASLTYALYFGNVPHQWALPTLKNMVNNILERKKQNIRAYKLDEGLEI
jgi:hypothetical protein